MSRHSFFVPALCAGALAATASAQGPVWQPLLPFATAPQPQVRRSGAVAFDPVRDRVAMVAGRLNLSGSAVYPQETWEFDGVDWHLIGPVGPIAFGSYNDTTNVRAYYDTQRGATVAIESKVGGPTIFHEWTGAAWVPILSVPQTTIPWRYACDVAYDPVRRKAVIFGGYTGNQEMGDTCEFNGTTAMARMCLALMPAAVIVVVQHFDDTYDPFAGLGWLAWLVVLAVHLVSLRRLGERVPAPVLGVSHVLGCWVVLAVLSLEQHHLLREAPDTWRWLGWALVPTVYLLLLAAPGRLPWPVKAFTREYQATAALPVAVFALGWFWVANALTDGAAAPLPYIPVLSPLELGMMLALFAVIRWSPVILEDLQADALGRLLRAVTGASLFALITAAVLRTAHHWAGIRWDIDALLAAMVVQAGLSIVWTLVALGLMISGHLRARRVRWTVGAGLIGVDVIKLLFVRLGSRGTLYRIVSFIGVGVLLLIVGYFAPLPPRRRAPDE